MIVWSGPEEAAHVILLAPGDEGRLSDGAPTLVADRLALAGIRVARFAFPPCESPDSDLRDELVARQVRAAAAEVSGAVLVVGGFSRGGRVSAGLASELGAAGVVAFAFPFHPRQSPDAGPRLKLLRSLDCPILIVQGTRDSHGNLQQVRGYDLAPTLQLHWLEDANHALHPRARSGHTQPTQLTAAADIASQFILGLAQPSS
ncbi:MAG: dienelactone hydrolase family protein [Proteobacteria bacterium]|nr:dienelactone hydrolase family protein [Pseudomonadota bacterium]